jgi:hypothetical protein
LFVQQVKYEYINTGTSKVNRQLLCVKLSPITNGSKDLDSEKEILLTFVGFENDKLIDSPSVLDRVLKYKHLTQNYTISNTRICTRKINDKYVCDHLPLLFDLIIN